MLAAGSRWQLGCRSRSGAGRPLADRWQSFGWRPVEVDGHDPGALKTAFAEAAAGESPCAILARTAAGKGVAFMEGQVQWHYLPMTDEQYARACAEVVAGP